MLKKNFIFTVFTVFATLNSFFSTLFGQSPVGYSNSNIIIEEMIAGGGNPDARCRRECYEFEPVSVSVIEDLSTAYLPTLLHNNENLTSNGNPAGVTYNVSYDIEIIGCGNSPCISKLNIIFYKRICEAKMSMMVPTLEGKAVASEDKINIKSDEKCFPQDWSIDILFSKDGLILKPNENSDCIPTFKVTQRVSRCLWGGSQSKILSTTHPNPTTDLLDLQFEGVKEGTANIQVYNNIGTLVQEIPSVSVYQGKNNTEMDLSNLPAGLYNIVIRQGETAATQRIQKL